MKSPILSSSTSSGLRRCELNFDLKDQADEHCKIKEQSSIKSEPNCLNRQLTWLKGVWHKTVALCRKIANCIFKCLFDFPSKNSGPDRLKNRSFRVKNWGTEGENDGVMSKEVVEMVFESLSNLIRPSKLIEVLPCQQTPLSAALIQNSPLRRPKMPVISALLDPQLAVLAPCGNNPISPLADWKSIYNWYVLPNEIELRCNLFLILEIYRETSNLRDVDLKEVSQILTSLCTRPDASLLKADIQRLQKLSSSMNSELANLMGFLKENRQSVLTRSLNSMVKFAEVSGPVFDKVIWQAFGALALTCARKSYSSLIGRSNRTFALMPKTKTIIGIFGQRLRALANDAAELKRASSSSHQKTWPTTILAFSPHLLKKAWRSLISEISADGEAVFSPTERDLAQLTIGNALTSTFDLKTADDWLLFSKLIVLNSLCILTLESNLSTSEKDLQGLVKGAIALDFKKSLTATLQRLARKGIDLAVLEQVQRCVAIRDLKFSDLSVLDISSIATTCSLPYFYRLASSKLAKNLFNGGIFNALSIWQLERLICHPHMMNQSNLAWTLWFIHCIWPGAILGSAIIPWDFTASVRNKAISCFQRGTALMNPIKKRWLSKVDSIAHRDADEKVQEPKEIRAQVLGGVVFKGDTYYEPSNPFKAPSILDSDLFYDAESIEFESV